MRVRLRPTCLAAAAASALLAAPGATSAAAASVVPSGSSAALSGSSAQIVSTASSAVASLAMTADPSAIMAEAGPQPALVRCVRIVAVSAAGPSIAERGQRVRTPQLPAGEYEGMLVAAVGAGMTAGGWLLVRAGGRKLQRRAGRRG